MRATSWGKIGPAIRPHRASVIAKNASSDAITTSHAACLQRTGQAADLVVQPLVGDVAVLRRVVPFPDDGGAIATGRAGMAVDTVHRRVQLSADEPLRMRRVPAYDVGPGLHPLERVGERLPERFRVPGGTFAALKSKSTYN